MESLYSVIPNISSYLTGNQNQNQNLMGFSSLSKNKLLKACNDLTGIFDNKNKLDIELPRLVVVGTQSSGKSSVLNRLMSIDILPTGKSMVTRTPFDIRLIKSSMCKIEFGSYQKGQWVVTNSYPISSPILTSFEVAKIQKEIQRQTDMIAGPGMSISTIPIILKIFFPNVPNLTLVDLPGLTMVACTDRGQPKDIKIQIRSLISSYIEKERTLILAIMPARTDLETDMSLDLIKEYDPKGDRTIGVLTKVDLMNKDNDISNYLQGDISKDLQLKYGYYAVKNRSNAQAEHMSALDALESEQEYFSKHSIYNKIKNINRIGINNLGYSLSNILIEQIKLLLPDISKTVIDKQIEINKILETLGYPVPIDADGQKALVHTLIAAFCREFIRSLEDRGTVLNYGKKIKNIFIQFRNKINEINPFSLEKCSDKYIKNAIDNCEGNHMSFQTPPIEVLEHCMTDPFLQPINKLKEPSVECLNQICELLKELTDTVLTHKHINRFPELSRKIKEIINNNIMLTQKQDTLNKIHDIINSEKSYIWTDDHTFIDSLKKLYDHDHSDKITNYTIVRTLLNEYYKTVQKNIKNSIPKFIMHFLVKAVQKKASSILFNELSDFSSLDEESDISKKRNIYIDQKNKLCDARKILSKI
jgi:hypothetical protein